MAPASRMIPCSVLGIKKWSIVEQDCPAEKVKSIGKKSHEEQSL